MAHARYRRARLGCGCCGWRSVQQKPRYTAHGTHAVSTGARDWAAGVAGAHPTRRYLTCSGAEQLPKEYTCRAAIHWNTPSKADTVWCVAHVLRPENTHVQAHTAAGRGFCEPGRCIWVWESGNVACCPVVANADTRTAETSNDARILSAHMRDPLNTRTGTKVQRSRRTAGCPRRQVLLAGGRPSTTARSYRSKLPVSVEYWAARDAASASARGSTAQLGPLAGQHPRRCSRAQARATHGTSYCVECGEQPSSAVSGSASPRQPLRFGLHRRNIARGSRGPLQLSTAADKQAQQRPTCSRCPSDYCHRCVSGEPLHLAGRPRYSEYRCIPREPVWRTRSPNGGRCKKKRTPRIPRRIRYRVVLWRQCYGVNAIPRRRVCPWHPLVRRDERFCTIYKEILLLEVIMFGRTQKLIN